MSSVFLFLFLLVKSDLRILADPCVCVVPSPIYETYCIDHYADGLCDQGCNTEECGWDGLDCAQKTPENLADGVLVLVVLLPPEALLRTKTAFLQKLSAILHTSVRFKLDDNGEEMIHPYTRKEARLKRELEPQQEVIGLVQPAANIRDEAISCEMSFAQLNLLFCFSCRSIVYVEIDNRLCSKESENCFPTAENAAEYLGALSAAEMLRFPYPLKEVRGEGEYSFYRIRTCCTNETQICNYPFSSDCRCKSAC